MNSEWLWEQLESDYLEPDPIIEREIRHWVLTPKERVERAIKPYSDRWQVFYKRPQGWVLQSKRNPNHQIRLGSHHRVAEGKAKEWVKFQEDARKARLEQENLYFWTKEKS